MPLKMISSQWSHITHNMAKARIKSISLLNAPSMTELQKASSEDATRRATPAALHASWTIGHVKNRWEQSSSSPAHRGQLMTAPGIMQRRMALVTRRRRKSSQPKSRIFSGSHCFNTTRQRWTKSFLLSTPVGSCNHLLLFASPCTKISS